MSLERLMYNPNLYPALSILGVIIVVAAIWNSLMDKEPSADRLKSVSGHRDELSRMEKKKKYNHREGLVSSNTLKSIVDKLRLERGKQMRDIRLKLARAGYRSREAVMAYLLMRLIAPIGMGLVGFFLIFVVQAFKMEFIFKVLSLVLSVIVGFALPEIFIKNQSQKRADILRKAMPDALDLMVICAEAGLSLDASLTRVSRELAHSGPELAEEIGLTGVELGFFPERSQALQNLADRVPLPGVMALANTLMQTEKYGTPLAQALRVLSAEMRNERIMAAETKAARLPATLTVPMILFILPPLFVVLLGPAILKVMQLMK